MAEIQTYPLYPNIVLKRTVLSEMNFRLGKNEYVVQDEPMESTKNMPSCLHTQGES